MKRVITLKGKANIGKTTTLKKFIELLTNKHSPSRIGHHINDIDVRGIFTINGKKIGIETQGDPYSRLPESLKLFQKEGCHLIVCATRSSGATVEAVKNLEQCYILSFRGQSAVSQRNWRDKSNLQIAKLILEEAESVIFP